MGLGNRHFMIKGTRVGIEALILGVLTNIGGFLFGYDTGQISQILLFNDFIDRFGQTNAQGEKEFKSIVASLLVSLMSIGTLFGALIGSYFLDRWGRRKTLAFAVFWFIIGNIIQITAMRSWVHITIGRMVAGLGVGSLSIAVPLYMSETSPKEIRGTIVASYQFLITIGILVANLINYGTRTIEDSDASWRIVIGIGIFFSLPLGIGIMFAPESPRWLAGKGDWEGAHLASARLRGCKDNMQDIYVLQDMQEMRESIEMQQAAGEGTWMECITGGASGIPRLVYRTVLGCAIQFLQQWTGVNYFFYYGATIFQAAGTEDPILVQLILGAVNVVCTVPGLWWLERVGRRTPLFYGALWQAVWLLIFASIGVARPPTEYESSGIVMIVAACMFIASFASTWGPGAWVVIGEIFPLRTRAKQASLATAFNWLGNFMIAFLTVRGQRDRVRLWFRPIRYQPRRSAPHLVLLLRIQRPLTRSRRHDVQRKGLETVAFGQMGARWVYG